MSIPSHPKTVTPFQSLLFNLNVNTPFPLHTPAPPFSPLLFNPHTPQSSERWSWFTQYNLAEEVEPTLELHGYISLDPGAGG